MRYRIHQFLTEHNEEKNMQIIIISIYNHENVCFNTSGISDHEILSAIPGSISRAHEFYPCVFCGTLI